MGEAAADEAHGGGGQGAGDAADGDDGAGDAGDGTGSLRELLDVERQDWADALHGELGQEVQFSVKFFDLADGAEPRQRMLVKQPAVVRLRPDRSPGEVLVRGLLE